MQAFAVIVIGWCATLVDVGLGDVCRWGSIGPQWAALVALIWATRPDGRFRGLSAVAIAAMADLASPGPLGISAAAMTMTTAVLGWLEPPAGWNTVATRAAAITLGSVLWAVGAGALRILCAADSLAYTSLLSHAAGMAAAHFFLACVLLFAFQRGLRAGV